MTRDAVPVREVVRPFNRQNELTMAYIEAEYRWRVLDVVPDEKNIEALKPYRDKPVFVYENLWIFEDQSALTFLDDRNFSAYDIYRQVRNERFLLSGETPAAAELRKNLKTVKRKFRKLKSVIK